MLGVPWGRRCPRGDWRDPGGADLRTADPGGVVCRSVGVVYRYMGVVLPLVGVAGKNLLYSLSLRGRSLPLRGRGVQPPAPARCVVRAPRGLAMSPRNGRRTGAHRAHSLARQLKTKRRRRDLDEIHGDLKPENAARLLRQEPDPDLPGCAQFYCLHCACVGRGGPQSRGGGLRRVLDTGRLGRKGCNPWGAYLAAGSPWPLGRGCPGVGGPWPWAGVVLVPGGPWRGRL